MGAVTSPAQLCAWWHAFVEGAPAQGTSDAAAVPCVVSASQGSTPPGKACWRRADAMPCACPGRVCLQAGSPAGQPQMPAPWPPGSLSCPAAPRGPCQPAAGPPHGSPRLRQLRQAQPLLVEQTLGSPYMRQLVQAQPLHVEQMCSKAWQAAPPCWQKRSRLAPMRASTRGSNSSSSSTRATGRPALALLLQGPGNRQPLCQLGSHRQPHCRWRTQGSDCRPSCRQHQWKFPCPSQAASPCMP